MLRMKTQIHLRQKEILCLSKLGTSRIMEWLSGIFIQEKGAQQITAFWYIYLFRRWLWGTFSHLLLTLSLFWRWKEWGSERLCNLSKNIQLENSRTGSKPRPAWLKKTIIILRKFKFLRRLRCNLENTYDKWESENIKLLIRLKPCKNMFTCGQRVKGNHWVITVDGNIL